LSYSDKHPHEAECVAPNCPFPGTMLVMVGGKPYWACEKHRQELTRHPDRVH
jgi:hypothetical protein